MSRAQRIGSRLPRFYRYWDTTSLVYSLLSAMASELDSAEKQVTNMMKAHWVDTAAGEELDRLGAMLRTGRIAGEEDAHFGARLKRAVGEYQGGGTVPAILAAVRALLGAKGEADVRIVENPPGTASAQFRVTAGATWALGSRSIADELPRLSLTVEEGGEVSEPQVTNLETGESVSFKGALRGGEQLIIEKNQATLNGTDVTSRLSADRPPSLLRKGSTWQYTESLQMLVGVFDTARFDQHTFAVRVPFVSLRFDWGRLQPASFELQIRSEALRESGLTETHIERFLASMKAAGVNATIAVTE